jgi:hypothetical protein
MRAPSYTYSSATYVAAAYRTDETNLLVCPLLIGTVVSLL